MNDQSFFQLDTDPKLAKPRKSYDGYLRTGVIGGLLLIFGFGGWASFASIEGAVIASGKIIVESQPKSIQHRDGGIIDEILVKNGDIVEVNDVVLRLNPTETKTEKKVAENRILEGEAEIARFNAELNNQSSIQWPESISTRQTDPEVSRVIANQTQLFNARYRAVSGEALQLRERKQQINEQIRGIEDVKTSRREQLRLIDAELRGLRELLEKGFVSSSRVMAIERQQASLVGDIASQDAETARLRSSLGEIDLQINQLTRNSRAETLAAKRQTESEVNDLRAQLQSLDDRVSRIELRAPVAGKVHDLAVTTIGGVVMPGDVLMQIIPQNDQLMIDAVVSTRDIDQIYPTQEATITLSAFNQRTTPQLSGTVIDISADSLTDKATGLPYYQALVEIPSEEIARLNGLKLVPGMPADVFIKTNSRTVSSYLLQPFTDTMKKAFREE